MAHPGKNLSNQFTISGFRSPIRLDVSSNSGGILVYIKEDILFKKIEGLEISKGHPGYTYRDQYKKTEMAFITNIQEP